MKAAVFEIRAKKYSVGLPNNKNDTATIVPKTTVLGIIGAFAKIQRNTEAYAKLMEGSMLDILIEAKTLLKKIAGDSVLNKEWKIVVNAGNPFREDVIFQVTAIPTNEEGKKLLEKFEKGVIKEKKRKKRDPKKAVYLGRQGYPLMIGEITWADFKKLSPEEAKDKVVEQNSIIPSDRNNIEIISEPEKAIGVPMAYSMEIEGLERKPKMRYYRITNDIKPFKVKIKGRIENSVYEVNGRTIICM
ncbi:MAG: hypothetical protein ACPLRZ_11530 [Thermovenabulum sp.]|uniref:hypothetical protein n=1 Tax=Thermovenabulum sp. TaxID=3100335 RepID=UPI003C7ECE92